MREERGEGDERKTERIQGSEVRSEGGREGAKKRVGEEGETNEGWRKGSWLPPTRTQLYSLLPFLRQGEAAGVQSITSCE